MAQRTLVASGEAATTIGSNGSVATFPASGNLWENRSVAGIEDVKVLVSLSASSNFTVRLMGSWQDHTTGSVFAGVIEQFDPSATLGDGAGREVFRSQGPQTHFTTIEIENSCASSTLDVAQLGLIWEAA